MTEVRNNDGRLVCQVNENNGDVEIKVKDCTTLIRCKPNGKPEIVNYNTSAKR